MLQQALYNCSFIIKKKKMSFKFKVFVSSGSFSNHTVQMTSIKSP